MRRPRSPSRSGRPPRWTAELLERHGFEVTAPVGGLETAFVARWRGSSRGPVIAFAGEYDALPEVGHGCGHNLMCSSSAGAAVAAASVLGRDFGGEIRFIGTPAEEAGNGKVTLLANGVFDDVDVCLQVHPSDSNSAEILALAVTEVAVTFHGKLAHASPATRGWGGTRSTPSSCCTRWWPSGGST